MRDDPLTARLAALYTGAVHDVLRAAGHDRCVLPMRIRPLDPSTKLAGPAWTLSGHVELGASRHDTLLGWVTVLSRAPAGHVVVCQPNTRDIALMGELSAETLAGRGVLGYLCDAPCRDTSANLEQRFPVFHDGFTPSDIAGRWLADRLGEPLTIGEVTVRTGDYVLGDRDGVVVIPRAIAAEVIDETERVERTENAVRDAIRAGVDPVDAYLAHGKF